MTADLPLLDELSNQGLELTDKAIQSLTIAAENARRLNRTCGTDDVLEGVVRSDTVVTKLICDLVTGKNQHAVFRELAEAQTNRRVHSQLILTRDDLPDLIPDFFCGTRS